MKKTFWSSFIINEERFHSKQHIMQNDERSDSQKTKIVCKKRETTIQYKSFRNSWYSSQDLRMFKHFQALQSSLSNMNFLSVLKSVKICHKIFVTCTQFCSFNYSKTFIRIFLIMCKFFDSKFEFDHVYRHLSFSSSFCTVLQMNSFDWHFLWMLFEHQNIVLNFLLTRIESIKYSS
jgi:hypothetical protein